MATKEQFTGMGLPESYEVEPRDLFSRWGFDDGDKFADAPQWLRSVEGIRGDHDEFEALMEAADAIARVEVSK